MGRKCCQRNCGNRPTLIIINQLPAFPRRPFNGGAGAGNQSFAITGTSEPIFPGDEFRRILNTNPVSITVPQTGNYIVGIGVQGVVTGQYALIFNFGIVVRVIRSGVEVFDTTIGAPTFLTQQNPSYALSGDTTLNLEARDSLIFELAGNSGPFDPRLLQATASGLINVIQN